METPLNNPRYDLAAARIALRAAEDHEKTIKAILTMSVAGTNEQQRKGNAAILLQHDDEYQDSLRELRTAEAAVDHAAAAVAVYEDELRRAELAARERLAEALMGKRVDNRMADELPERYHADYLLDAMDEQYNKTHVIHPSVAAHPWGACTCDECRAARADQSTWRNGGEF